MDKKERHEYIIKMLGENPFLKDDNLAQLCGVSVATIRLDRAELGIAQYRERIKTAAKEGLNIRPEKCWIWICTIMEYRFWKLMLQCCLKERRL